MYPLFIARRLSLRGDGRKRTPAMAVATTAVALSVAVMLASVAIVTGFKNEITRRVVGFNSHITVTQASNDGNEGNIVALTPGLKSILDSCKYIKEYGLQISMPAIIKTPGDFKGVYMRGIDSQAMRNFMERNLVAGTLPRTDAPDSIPEVLISEIASRQLGLKAGDKTDLYFMSDDIRVRRMKIAGIYNTHFDTYDDLYVYGPLSLMRGLSGLHSDEGVALTIDTDDFGKVADYTEDLQQRLLNGVADGTVYRVYRVDNVLSQGANYFRWLSLLDMNVLVVLGLMTAVACVTLVSGMLIIILDKKRFIGLMKALGTPSGNLRQIFIYLAMKIALTGMAIGNVLMLGLLWLQHTYHVVPLDPEAYYIDFVPAELTWESIVILNVGVLAVTYLVLVLPSRFVGKISPAELIRGEE